MRWRRGRGQPCFLLSLARSWEGMKRACVIARIFYQPRDLYPRYIIRITGQLPVDLKYTRNPMAGPGAPAFVFCVRETCWSRAWCDLPTLGNPPAHPIVRLPAGDTMKIRIAIIAACAGTMVLASANRTLAKGGAFEPGRAAKISDAGLKTIKLAIVLNLPWNPGDKRSASKTKTNRQGDKSLPQPRNSKGISENESPRPTDR
jgi:hypothetical protein